MRKWLKSHSAVWLLHSKRKPREIHLTDVIFDGRWHFFDDTDVYSQHNYAGAAKKCCELLHTTLCSYNQKNDRLPTCVLTAKIWLQTDVLTMLFHCHKLSCFDRASLVITQRLSHVSFVKDLSKYFVFFYSRKYEIRFGNCTKKKKNVDINFDSLYEKSSLSTVRKIVVRKEEVFL